MPGPYWCIRLTTRAWKNRLYRLPPKKDYHVYIARSTYHYAYARQTQVNWNEETKRKEEKIKDIKEKKAKNEKGKERKEKTRKAKKDKTRREEEARKGKRLKKMSC